MANAAAVVKLTDLPLLAGGQTQAEGDVGLAGSTTPENVIVPETCRRHDDVLAP